MKSLICTLVFLAAVSLLRAQQIPARAPDSIVVDASAPVAAPETGYLHLGGTSANRHSLQVNSRSLVLDNKPWLPVMGEFHFSRYPESQWEHEILKMQAAGVNILSTYVFWIHHEEIEGNFDWTGQRDLRHFVELCARHGMYVWLRIGPWAHGEVRNGGFPDWVTRLPNTRTNDPLYLHFVERFFNQIGLQVRGLTFKDGGPVIGTQLENE
jgi:beta-galactosidase GanA